MKISLKLTGTHYTIQLGDTRTTISVIVGILAISILGFNQEAFASTIESNGTGGGNWNDSSTWSGEAIPTPVDFVIIKNGDTVMVSSSIFIKFGGSITVEEGGKLIIGGTSDSDEWYIGEGLTQNDFFHYQLCHIGYKTCTTFDLFLTLIDETQDFWEFEFAVIDGDQVFIENVKIEKSTFQAQSPSSEIVPFVDSFRFSILWLSHFANEQEPKSFSANTWGQIGAIGGEQIVPSFVEEVSVPAGTFESVVITWKSGGLINKIWVVDGFPFPVKAETYIPLQHGIPPPAYTFELISTCQGSETIHNSNECVFVKKTSSGDNQWDTRPTFGVSHETRQGKVVENGFKFNNEQFSLTNNYYTNFAEQSIEIGTLNSFSATVYADKQLKIQEFLFGIPNVGESHLAELGVEVWYNFEGEIEDVIVVQKSEIIDSENVSVTHEKTKCLSSDSEAKCDITTISMTFLEPLKDKVMAIKAIDWKNRDQRTYLNDGFDISGNSLNPMLTKMIPSTLRDEGLLMVTQVEKYSPYWIAEDGRTFEMNSFGTFKQINQKFERFQDSGEAKTRLHSGFGVKIHFEQDKALEIFDSSKIMSAVPGTFAYKIEFHDRMNQELIEQMYEQEQIANKILEESRVQARW